jgi:hypothetical protein
VYKITYPNKKIYIGQDVTDKFMTYFGSVDKDYLHKDFTPEQLRNFSIHKEILWESETASPSELTKKEHELIKQCESNNPAKGYNLIPKYTAK